LSAHLEREHKKDDVWKRFSEKTAQLKTRLAQQQEAKQDAKPKQPSINSMFDHGTAYSYQNTKMHRLNTLLVYLVCKEGLPFNILGSQAFQMFVHELDPWYKLLTRQCLSARLIPEAYEKRKRKLRRNYKQYLMLP
jgi:hypothetical protein